MPKLANWPVGSPTTRSDSSLQSDNSDTWHLGQINRRKNQDASMHHLSSSPSRRPRPSPYGSNRGGPKFQSKSLINHHRVGGDKVNNTTSPIPPDVEVLNGMNSSPRSGCGGIAKSGRGAKTWMSEDSLRRKMKRREKFGAPGSIQSLEKSKAISQLQAKPPTRVSPATRSDDIAVHDTQLQNGERQSQSIVNGKSRGRPRRCEVHMLRNVYRTHKHGQSHTNRFTRRRSNNQATQERQPRLD